MTLTYAEAVAEIVRADREIDALRDRLASLEQINPESPESWQAAGTKHPDLHAEEAALFSRRDEWVQIREQASARRQADRRNGKYFQRR